MGSRQTQPFHFYDPYGLTRSKVPSETLEDRLRELSLPLRERRLKRTREQAEPRGNVTHACRSAGFLHERLITRASRFHAAGNFRG